MAQVITLAGERLFATQAQLNQPLDIDTFIFANVPGQDPNAAIDRSEGLPPIEQRVHTQVVQQYGKINENVVVYSTVLDSLAGPFDFNWVGLYSSVHNTLIAVQHIPTISKTKTVPGAAGNTLNRNFGIEYSGIAELTGITVAPETWQLDFTARLAGMDKLTQDLANDVNGKYWFTEDGFKIVNRGTVNTYSVTEGVGYIHGLRAELKTEEILFIDTYPKAVFIDCWFASDASSSWSPQFKIIVSEDELNDYESSDGKLHYIYKLADISAQGVIIDKRSGEGIKEKVEKHITQQAGSHSANQINFESGLNAEEEVKTVRETISDYSEGSMILRSEGLRLFAEGINMVFDSGELNAVNADILLGQNSEKYVYLNLYTHKLHAFNRAIDNTAYLLCKVKTDSEKIVEIKRVCESFPVTYIGNFLGRKRQVFSTNIRDIRVAILGDSIMKGAGEAPYWDELIFNSANSSYGLNIAPDVARYDVYNYGAGGQTAEFVNAVLSNGIVATGSTYNRTNRVYDYQDNFKLPIESTKECGVSPLIRDPYDLVIIGAGANPSRYSLFALEAAIRNLKKAGSEIVVVTQNFKVSDNNYLSEQTKRLSRICEANGVSLVDTWEYYSESVENGQNPFADDIHGSVLGQTLYAEAIMGCIGTLYKHVTVRTTAAKPIMRGTEFNFSGSYPQKTEIQFTPFFTTGSLYDSGLNTLNNLAVLIGNRTYSENDTYILNTGDYAEFQHDYMANVDFLVIDDTEFTAQLSTADGTIDIGNIITKAKGTHRIAMVEGPGITTFNPDAPNRSNKTVRITCLSGQIKLVGAVFKTDERNPINLYYQRKTASWFFEDWEYSTPYSMYTDNVGEEVQIEYEGSELVLSFASQSASGIVDIYRDGEKVIGGLNLYSTGTLIKTITIRSGNALNPALKYNSLPSKHVVRVVLKHDNSEGNIPAEKNRKLSIISAVAFNKS